MLKILASVACVLCALVPGMAGLNTEQNIDTDELQRYGAVYYEGGRSSTVSETITFDRKEVTSYENPYKAPTFSTNTSNACAVDAGGNALIYYDRLYNDLVPNYQGTTILGQYSYGSLTSGVTDMFKELRGLMGTTSISGTTIYGFKSGMVAYGNNHSHTVSVTSYKGNYYNLSYGTLKQQFNKGKLAVIFLDGYSLVSLKSLSVQSGQETIEYTIFNDVHAVLAYGYKEVYYYDPLNKLIGYGLYLYVSTGNYSMPLAYLSVSAYSEIDDAYVIDVQ